MKLIQLNAWNGNLRYSVVNFLKDEDADIVNLQEVTTGFGEKSWFFSLHAMLRNRLGYKYEFYSPIFRGRVDRVPVSQGQMILSKYPIKAKKAVNVAGSLADKRLFGGSGIEGSLQHARIRIDGETINDLNYHGMVVWGTKMGNGITELHSRRVVRYMRGLDQDEKIILSGDFNLAPSSKSLRLISKHYSDLISRYGIRTTRNELSIFSEPVDNIFVNDRVRVRSLKAPRVYVSDHLPLIMNFD